jgi:hypothetical protein
MRNSIKLITWRNHTDTREGDCAYSRKLSRNGIPFTYCNKLKPLCIRVQNGVSCVEEDVMMVNALEICHDKELTLVTVQLIDDAHTLKIGVNVATELMKQSVVRWIGLIQ